MINLKKIRKKYPRSYKLADEFLLKQWRSRSTHQISHTALNHMGTHVAVIEFSETRGSGYSYSDDIEIETPLEDLIWFFEDWGYYIEILYAASMEFYNIRIKNPRRVWEHFNYDTRYNALETAITESFKIFDQEAIADKYCGNCRFWVSKKNKTGVCDRLPGIPDKGIEDVCRFWVKRKD